eukprot:TRINITY_DN7764_c0_g1_i9.p1 TRINITY_DN7764_c0_g1~~TRINITY_DN7764_c0_g1_i9.p1  ORF type:complete len:235 (-),score=70.81 TRINITY_DN7764_c0_g1_i9:215-919(-)
MAQSGLALGDRVAVNSTSGVLGTIRFLGTTHFAAGEWVGVELDGPGGKNCGEVKGQRYFSCPDKHGVFVRQSAVVKQEPVDKPARKQSEEEPQSLVKGIEAPSTTVLQATAAAYEAEWAQRFKEQQALVADMEAARASIARVGEAAKAAQMRAEAAERGVAAEASTEALNVDIAAQLERRVLSGIDARMQTLLQGVAQKAAGDAFAMASQELAMAVAEVRQRRLRKAGVSNANL